MKSSILALMAGCVLATLAGCTTHYRDSDADYLVRPHSVSSTPYHTEFNVSQNKITGTAEAAVLFGIFDFSEGKYCQLSQNGMQLVKSFWPTERAIYKAKSAALFKACETNKADQLLGATFDYKVLDCLIFTKVECKITGYPANATGIKKISKMPVVMNKWQKIEYLSPEEVNTMVVTPSANAVQSKMSSAVNEKGEPGLVYQVLDILF